MNFDLQSRLRKELRAAASPERAPAMQQYMKSKMPYLGVPAPAMRRVCRTVFPLHPLDGALKWRLAVLKLWTDAKFREERYAAIELTGYRLYDEHQTMQSLSMYETLIVTGAWWDYVDVLASRRLGPLLEKYPEAMRKTMLAWSRSDDLWKRRSAILSQLTFKKNTDLELLYATLEPALESKEFFLRKAIGWALRQYAWTDAREVFRYVEKNRDRLSPLSQREALKNVIREGRTVRVRERGA